MEWIWTGFRLYLCLFICFQVSPSIYRTQNACYVNHNHDNLADVLCNFQAKSFYFSDTATAVLFTYKFVVPKTLRRYESQKGKIPKQMFWLVSNYLQKLILS